MTLEADLQRAVNHKHIQVCLNYAVDISPKSDPRRDNAVLSLLASWSALPVMMRDVADLLC
jgi:hypothetical protein